MRWTEVISSTYEGTMSLYQDYLSKRSRGEYIRDSEVWHEPIFCKPGMMIIYTY